MDKRHESHIRMAVGAVLSLLAGLLAGCREPYGDAPAGEEGVAVTMTITADDLGASSAAADPDDTIHTLWVYAFRGNTQIGGYRIEDAAASYPDGRIRFLMDLSLPSYTEPSDVIFYVVANAESFHNGPSSSQPSGATFFQPRMSRAQLDGYTFEGLRTETSQPMALPMTLRTTRRLDPSRLATTGVAPGHEGHYQLLDPQAFSLQRCVGRVEFYVARERGSERDFTLDIHSVTISPAGPSDWGYAFPAASSLLEQIPHTATTPIYVVGSAWGEAVRVTAEASREEQSMYEELTAGRRYYCCENPFGSATADEAGDSQGYELRVIYSIDGGGKSEKSIYLPPTERNTRYRVWCCVPYDGLIYVNYTVEEWVDTGDVDLTFDYPEYEFRPYVDSDYTTQTHYAPDGTSDGSVRFSFMMRKGISWIPSLEGDAGGYRINVYPFGTPTEWDGLPLAPGETWYTIEVRPVHGVESYWDPVTGSTQPPVAYLTITTQLWNRPSMKLEINPTGAFPCDGAPGTDYTSYIQITQGENI